MKNEEFDEHFFYNKFHEFKRYDFGRKITITHTHWTYIK